SGPVSDYFDGTPFHSPGQPSSDRSLWDLLRWRLDKAKRAVWLQHIAIDPSIPPAHSVPPRTTMVGYATVLIQIADRNILTDRV
ncbi:hypothetical protein ACOI1H_18075, partial [Loktanella sp. DJP18]